MPELVLERKGFKGTVILHDWITDPTDGEHYMGFHGTVSVFADTEVVGFEAKGHGTANWMARVEGPTSSINLMGCQVRAIAQSECAPSVTKFKSLT